MCVDALNVANPFLRLSIFAVIEPVALTGMARTVGKHNVQSVEGTAVRVERS